MAEALIDADMQAHLAQDVFEYAVKTSDGDDPALAAIELAAKEKNPAVLGLFFDGYVAALSEEPDMPAEINPYDVAQMAIRAAARHGAPVEAGRRFHHVTTRLGTWGQVFSEKNEMRTRQAAEAQQRAGLEAMLHAKTPLGFYEKVMARTELDPIGMLTQHFYNDVGGAIAFIEGYTESQMADDQTLEPDVIRSVAYTEVLGLAYGIAERNNLQVCSHEEVKGYFKTVFQAFDVLQAMDEKEARLQRQ